MDENPVYYRSSGSRFLALCGIGIPGFLLAVTLPGGFRLTLGMAVVLFFLAAGLTYAVVAFGDRFVVDEAGLHRSNPWLQQLGLKGRWDLPIEEIRSHRFHKEKVLFLHRFKGRTWILEGIDGLDIISQEVERHLKNHRDRLDRTT